MERGKKGRKAGGARVRKGLGGRTKEGMYERPGIMRKKGRKEERRETGEEPWKKGKGGGE